MTDRRRLNAPPGGTAPPLFTTLPASTNPAPTRTRSPSTPRRIFLQTGIVPSASGSAYYELQPSSPPISSPLSSLSKSASPSTTFTPSTSQLKLIVTVHGPRPLPRNNPYSSTLVLNAHVKFAPFATRIRRGYVRDSGERDLAAHLGTALRGVVLAERFPKSCVDVVVTVLEGEAGQQQQQQQQKREGIRTVAGIGDVGAMTALAGCITAASAALVDAGIDCVDLVAGGVVGIVADGQGEDAQEVIVVDPCPGEHSQGLKGACVVGYLQSRDEIAELWLKGDVGTQPENLIDEAVEAARLSRVVLAGALTEAAVKQFEQSDGMETPVEGAG